MVGIVYASDIKDITLICSTVTGRQIWRNRYTVTGRTIIPQPVVGKISELLLVDVDTLTGRVNDTVWTTMVYIYHSMVARGCSWAIDGSSAAFDDNMWSSICTTIRKWYPYHDMELHWNISNNGDLVIELVEWLTGSTLTICYGFGGLFWVSK